MKLARFIVGETVHHGIMTGTISACWWEAGPEFYAYDLLVPIRGKDFRVMRIPEEYLVPEEKSCDVQSVTE